MTPWCHDPNIAERASPTPAVPTSARTEVEVAGRRLSHGESFGEVALLRDVPRTATVTAVSDVVLYALKRDLFVAAVTGHAPARSTAEAVIASHLGGFQTDWAQVMD